MDNVLRNIDIIILLLYYYFLYSLPTYFIHIVNRSLAKNSNEMVGSWTVWQNVGL
jgi:hypothetical protein